MKKRYVIATVFAVILLYFTHHIWLGVKHHIHFDIMLFLIIFILGGGLCYKITSYLADFKTLKYVSRLDIIFVTIFFILLFIPMMHISQDEKSMKENRYLAKWSPLILKNNKINYEFGKNFNEWYNDRFFLRQTLVNARSFLMISIANKCEKGFLDNSTQTTYENGSFSHRDIQIVKENFKVLYEFNKYCAEHNIKLYILIVPKKADIHTTKYDYIKNDNRHNEFLKYVNDISKEDTIKVIYPYKEMKKAEKEGKQLYFKTEHHWTDDGAFIGYKELMKEIVKDYPDIKVLDNNDFNYFKNTLVRGDWVRKFMKGQDCWRLGISDALCRKYHKFNYTYFTHKDKDNLVENVIDEEYLKLKIYHYDKGANYRVILLGTSQNENLTEFIPYTFKDVKRLRNNSVKGVKYEDEFKIFKYFEKEMLDYHPDIIIFGIEYGNIAKLHDLFNKE